MTVPLVHYWGKGRVAPCRVVPEAEVGEFDVQVLIEQQILGFEVAMHLKEETLRRDLLAAVRLVRRDLRICAHETRVLYSSYTGISCKAPIRNEMLEILVVLVEQSTQTEYTTSEEKIAYDLFAVQILDGGNNLQRA